MKEDVVARLKVFIENEMRSCSMDYGCITAEYVYRMWGGFVYKAFALKGKTLNM